jgi:predicted dienelactone hydrolase
MHLSARPRRPRTLLALTLGAYAAGAIACGGDGGGGPENDTEGGGGGAAPVGRAEELLGRGPQAVGYRQMEVRYRPAGATADRVLPLHVWYPASAAGEAPATYAVGGVVSLPSAGALAAPALAPGGPFPLAVYSHGSGGEGLLGYPYAERFASHGWVVAAPTHVGNSALDTFAGTAAPAARVALDRPRDVSAVLDAFAAGLGGDALGGAARADRVFLFGHSFGGYTAFAGGGVDLDVAALRAGCAAFNGCEALDDPAVDAGLRGGFGDPRVAAIAPQAPALVSAFGAGQLAGLGVPTLLMSGRLDRTTPDADNAAPAWAGLDNRGDLRVELPQGGHLSFVTVCTDLDPALLARLQPGAADDGCGPAFTPVAETVPALAAYLLGFARWHVLGESRWASVLRGEPLHPAVVVSAH